MYTQTPNSPAEEFALEEENGITLILNGRFLPYRPIRIEGRQRAEFTWYPGSPEATVQMLGPEEGTIRLNGYWKDKFLDVGMSAVVLNPPVNGTFTDTSTSLTSTSALVQTVDNMRRMGRQITLKWSGLLRVGHIVSFAHTWHNVHDCEWEIEFAVLSQGEATVPSVSGVSITPPDIYAQAVKDALRLQDAIINASGLPLWIKTTTQTTLQIEAALLISQAAVGAAGDAARGYADATFSVTQAARNSIASMTSTVFGLGVQANTLADTALSEALSFGIYGSMDNSPLGAQLASNSIQRTISDAMRTSRYNFSSTRRLLAVQSAGDAAQIRTVIPPNDTDLRTISNRYYSTSDYWQDLMVYNGLSSSTAPRGQTIYIPPATAFSDRDTTRGN